MIDIHCHILPGLDDGPQSLDESFEMCRMAAHDGITTIVATPHFKPGMYEPGCEKIYELIGILEARLKQEGLDIKILPGSDVAVTPELPMHLKKKEHLTINKNNKYFLAEFDHFMVPPNWEAFFFSLINSGWIPIITHPERNAWFFNHPDALYPVVENGVLIQITAMSITGRFGKEIQDFCIALLKSNLVHVIATDAHSAADRPPLLTEAVRMASDVIGKERALSLVTTIPAAIIEGRYIPLPKPAEIVKHKKSWFQRLLAYT